MNDRPKFLYPRQSGKTITNTGTFQIEDQERVEALFERLIVDAYGIILANPKDEDKLQEEFRKMSKKQVVVVKHKYIEPGKFYEIIDYETKRKLLIEHGILKNRL